MKYDNSFHKSCLLSLKKLSNYTLIAFAGV